VGFFGEGDLAMIVPPKTEMLGIYPANYHEARDLFRQAAQDLGAHLENHAPVGCQTGFTTPPSCRENGVAAWLSSDA